jgi:outer membrane protein assembly factor BamB
MKIITATVSIFFAAHLIHANDFESQRANNWHQWRGPNSNGVATDADPPLEWNETKNVKWKVELSGLGSSSPVVWGDKIFLTSSIRTERVSDAPIPKREIPKVELPEGAPELSIRPVPRNYYKFLVTALDRNTGKKLWEKKVAEEVPHRAHHKDHGYASSSPTTDGERIYVSFGSVGIFCLNLEGEVKWSRDLADLEVPNDFGEAVTPVLYGDHLVVVMDQLNQSFIEILDRKTGATAWKKNRVEMASWSTPLVTSFEGRDQVIVCGSHRVICYDLKTGDAIWECGGLGKAIIPTPVRDKDLVFCMTGYLGDSLQAIRLDSKGDVTDSDQIVWRTDKGTPYVPSPLLYDDQLYFNRKNQGILTSLKAETGEALIESTRMPHLSGNIYASPVGAAGRIYFVNRNGSALVIKHGAEFEVLAKNQLDDVFNATPAIVGNELILRGSKYLYCLSEE